MIGHAIQKIMKKGEKEAPVKDLELEVKFQSPKNKAIKKKLKK